MAAAACRVAAACAGVALPEATVVEAFPMAVCRFGLTVASRGSDEATAFVISLLSAACWTLGVTRLMFDQLGWTPLSAAMSSSAFATCSCPAVEVPSQTAKVAGPFGS